MHDLWRNANIPPGGPGRCQRTLNVEGDINPSIGHEGTPFQPKTMDNPDSSAIWQIYTRPQLRSQHA